MTAIFKKSILRHNSAALRPITTKFVRHMQTDMPTTTRGSIWKAKVEFQYGGCLFPISEIVLFQPWIEICHRNFVCK